MERGQWGEGAAEGAGPQLSTPACRWGGRVPFWGPWSGARTSAPVYPHPPVDFSILSQGSASLGLLALSPRLTCDTGQVGSARWSEAGAAV